MHADRDALIGCRFGDGRYEVIGLLGGGGMGAVYRARDSTTGGDVALKVLHQRLAAEGTHLARFRREAEVASALSHPNVVRVVAHGAEADGIPWLVMELIGGESLAKLGAREAPMDVARAVRIARQIAYALTAVHSVGVVHRDLKPGNVMVARVGDRDEIKVVDFGIARFFGTKAFERLTATGQVVGTPTYMAPEQAFGGAVDERTDLYAVGAILCALLTGHAPHGGGTYYDVLTRLLGGDRVPLSDSHPHLGPVVEVVERCLAFDPDDRYASMAELDAALASFDPSPTTTLVDWSPTVRTQTLRLAPDPVLDAVPEAAQTAFQRAARGRRGGEGVMATRSTRRAGGAAARQAAAAPVPVPVPAPAVGGEDDTASPVKTPRGRVLALVGLVVAAGLAVVIGAFVIGSGRGGAPPAVRGPDALEPHTAAPAVTPMVPIESTAASRDSGVGVPDASDAVEGAGNRVAAATSPSSTMGASRPVRARMDRMASPRTPAPQVHGSRLRMTLQVQTAGAWSEAEIRAAFAPGLRRGNACLAALTHYTGPAGSEIARFLFSTNGEAQGAGLSPEGGGIGPELRSCTSTTIDGIRLPPRDAPRQERNVAVRLHITEVRAASETDDGASDEWGF